MLFSNPDVADLMNDRFVCAWESVRSVPTVEIDFGNGHHMKRTLNGNVITFLCTPEGKVFDALPGLYSAEGYTAALHRALDLFGTLGASQEKIARYHSLAANGEEKIGVTAKGRVVPTGPMRYASKSVVEEPIKVLVANGLDTPEAKYAMEARNEPGPDERVAAGKTMVERPVKRSLASARESLLAEDTAINERLRKEQIHAMLSRAPLPVPKDIRGRIYKEVLHVDVDDPYLGLGHILFNGAEGETK